MPPFDGLQDFVKPDVPLAPLVWFRLGGHASFFAKPRTLDDLLSVMKRARDASIALRILGGGSNVLVRDAGVDALVIHLESPFFSDVSVTENIVTAGTAVPLTALISQTARAGLAGLEILTGIPGTVGGALRGNAGSRQGAIGQFVRRATVLDSAGEIQVRERDDLSFADRTSNLDEPVIVSAELRVRPRESGIGRPPDAPDLDRQEGKPTLRTSIVRMHLQEPVARRLCRALIDQAGLKGARFGGAEVSDRHANFIFAHPGATASDVLHLIEQIQQRVWQQFGYELELQLQIW